MNSEKDCLIFLHIPKTAGSTFHTILNGRYRKNQIYNVFGSRYHEPEIDAFIKLPLDKKTHIRLLKGHMPFGLHQYLDCSSKYITILRDPIERVISQYYYIKKNTFNPLHEQVEKGNMTIAEFVSSGISVGMNNGHCRFLNGDLDQYGFDQCDSTLYDHVVQHIKEHFLWVGITERFDESILLLAKKIGWKKLPYYIRANVSKTRKPRKTISDEDLNAIEKYNTFDIQLYRYCSDLLDEQIREYPNFAQELEQYKAKNQKLQERWGWLPDNLRRFVV